MAHFTDMARSFGDLEDFFGCPLNRVNKTVQLMVLGKRAREWPEWLRGRPQLTNLPRYSDAVIRNEDAAVFPIPVVRNSEIAARVGWIVENLSGSWAMGSKGFAFLDPDDAFSYRMRWTL